MMACHYNYPSAELVKLLLEKGADINIQNIEGNTALMMACKSITPSAEVVKLLLEKGADVNIQNIKGNTALMMACHSYEKPIEVIKLLLDKGANVNLTNQEKDTAFMLTKTDEIKKLFISILTKTEFDEKVKGTDTYKSCPVCLEDFIDGKTIIKTHCGHYFHTTCLQAYCAVTQKCPYCREDIPLEYNSIAPPTQQRQTTIHVLGRAINNGTRAARANLGRAHTALTNGTRAVRDMNIRIHEGIHEGIQEVGRAINTGIHNITRRRITRSDNPILDNPI